MGDQEKRRNKRRSADEWQRLLAEQARSGSSIRAFCAERGIGYSTFSKRKSRLARDSQTRKAGSQFVELAPLQPLSNGQWDIELALGDDIVLRLSRH
jgi:transposase-like protein